MAEMVRLNEDLLAIRLDLVVRDRTPLLVAELFRGWESVGRAVHVPLQQLGARPEGLDGPLFDRAVAPPDRLWTLFHSVNDHAEDGELLWLQIADGADILAAYPWEAAFSIVAGRMIARVPNFLRDPFRRDDPRPFVICAGSPNPWDAAELQARTEVVLSTLVDSGVRMVQIFTDGTATWAEDLVQISTELSVWHYPLPFAPPAASRAENPLLGWIVQLLGRAGARAVHFVCPCVAIGTDGAIVLPATGSGVAGAVGAAPVCAEEVAAFLDRLDCPLAGFSPLVPYDQDEGARLLVNDLSWRRPGPIVAEFGGAGDLEQVYSALFSFRELWLPPNPGTIISAHPNVVADYDGPVRTVSAVARRELSLDEPSRHHDPGPGRPEEPRWLTQKLDQLSSARPRSPTQMARDRGAMKALDFVSQLTAERDR